MKMSLRSVALKSNKKFLCESVESRVLRTEVQRQYDCNMKARARGKLVLKQI